MPLVVILHKIYSLSRNSVRDDNTRTVRDRSCHAGGIDNTLHVVTVDLLHMPAKRLPLTTKIFERHYVISRSVNLDIIAINIHNQLT
ncbi:hypothetical protein D3C85_1373760 [compost metagenome]